MALVAYDNSDSSELEDDESENVPVVILNQKTESAVVVQPTTSQSLVNGIEISPPPSTGERSLFNLLPSTTKKKAVIEEEDDEFLHKKETPTIKPKAKITVPSLSDFRDVEDRPAAARPKTSNGKKSGLLSMLPQPKHAGMSTTSLIPNAVKKKQSAPLVPTSLKKTPLPSPMKKAKSEAKGLVTTYSDDSDNDDEETTDFFSINKPIDISPIESEPLDIDMEPAKVAKTVEKKPGIESYFKKDVPEHVELQSDYSEQSDNVTEYYAQENAGYSQEASYSTQYTAPESSGSNNDVLDDEAIRQLIGSRGKRKREDIQIVDVNQQEVLGDSKEWLLKGLMDDTTKRVSSSKKTGNEPSAQQRRKHQITYLAHQAKANEAELQNQWANSRISKRKTQSKYGF
ncbi:hypothetical protein O0L34_g14818 [Tuta absoluta]|nr:hypothetical protein O0L34_g14818 [Tuta absoluta]